MPQFYFLSSFFVLLSMKRGRVKDFVWWHSFLLNVTMMPVIWLRAQTVFVTLSRHPERRTVADMQQALSQTAIDSRDGADAGWRPSDFMNIQSIWVIDIVSKRWLQHKREKATYGRQNLQEGQRKLLFTSLQKKVNL